MGVLSRDAVIRFAPMKESLPPVNICHSTPAIRMLCVSGNRTENVIGRRQRS